MDTKKSDKKTVKRLTSFFILIGIVGSLTLVIKLLTSQKADITNISDGKNIHTVAFYDEELFWKGIQKAENITSDFHIKAGIVPHHLLASFIIADFFHRLSYRKPKTIILLGPNHGEKGNFKVLTSLYGWNTSLGIVKPNESVIKSLIAQKLSQVDEQVLPQDQSIAVLPFIKYYIPKATIVPLLISHNLNQQESKELAEALGKLEDKDTVVVASVDFSHYLTNLQAEKKDEITLQVLKDHDYRSLFLLNSDYLDSPASIATVLMLAESVGAKDMQIYYHTNSADIVKNNAGPTTSYFSIAYY